MVCCLRFYDIYVREISAHYEAQSCENELIIALQELSVCVYRIE